MNDLVVKAASLALRRVPEVNRAWGGDHMVQPGSESFPCGLFFGGARNLRERLLLGIDVAVAVATDGGLITPGEHCRRLFLAQPYFVLSD